MKKNRKLNLIILFLCVYIINTSINCSAFQKKELSKCTKCVNWLKDIDYLQANLPKKHLNFYHTMKKYEFDKKIRLLKNDLIKLNDSEVVCRLSQIIASVGDAHTALRLNFKDNYYPLGLYWFGNDLRVFATTNKYKKILGLKLVSINNRPINDIISDVNTLISHENNNWLRSNNVQYVIYDDILRYFKITSNKQTHFIFEDDSHKRIDVLMTTENFTSENITKILDSAPKKPRRLNYDPTNMKQNLFWHEYIPSVNSLYVQINQCFDRTTAQRYNVSNYMEYPLFSEFADSVIETLQKTKAEKIIIDLRANSGGDSALISELIFKLNILLSFEANNLLNSKIFVVIGRDTYSSAVLNAYEFKTTIGANLIGEDTGGNLNSYGDIKYLELPISKLQISYSTKYFNISNKYQTALVPDIYVEESYESYVQGIDDIYNKIFDIETQLRTP